jgi:hypothetical protein
MRCLHSRPSVFTLKTRKFAVLLAHSVLLVPRCPASRQRTRCARAVYAVILVFLDSKHSGLQCWVAHSVLLVPRCPALRQKTRCARAAYAIIVVLLSVG